MPCRTAAGATLVKSLSELLQSANTEGLSARSIARQAQALGYSLNHDTAARYLRGDHGRPDEDTLLALASVLKLPLAPLRKAAQLPSEVTEPYRPPPEASRLSRRQRRAVDEIIRAMLESSRGEPARSKAARRGGAEPPAAH
jgi:transcriptional regulator with XRE-family HTH domain